MHRHGPCPVCLGSCILATVPAEPDVVLCRCGRCGRYRVTSECVRAWPQSDHVELGVPGSSARNTASVWIRYHQALLSRPRAVLVDRDAAWLALGRTPPGVDRRHHWAVVHGGRRAPRATPTPS